MLGRNYVFRSQFLSLQWFGFLTRCIDSSSFRCVREEVKKEKEEAKMMMTRRRRRGKSQVSAAQMGEENEIPVEV